jgi:hypothetical protein
MFGSSVAARDHFPLSRIGRTPPAVVTEGGRIAAPGSLFNMASPPKERIETLLAASRLSGGQL